MIIKKFYKDLLIIISIVASVFFLSIIAIFGFFSYCQYKIDTDKPRIESKLEPNLNFVNSQLEYLYYKDSNLYIASINGKNNKHISDYAKSYAYDRYKNRIAFVSDSENEIVSYIKVYNLKNKVIDKIFKVNRHKEDGLLCGPLFSPSGTKLLYRLGKSAFIINLIDNSNELVLTRERLGSVRWDVNDSDIWSWNYNGETIKHINPLKSNNSIHYTDIKNPTVASQSGLEPSVSYTDIIHTPFANINNSEFVLRNNNKVLVKYNPGFSWDSTFKIEDFDYTKNIEYLLFTINQKIYVCKIKTGQVGYLTDGNYPRFIGINSMTNN